MQLGILKTLSCSFLFGVLLQSASSQSVTVSSPEGTRGATSVTGIQIIPPTPVPPSQNSCPVLLSVTMSSTDSGIIDPRIYAPSTPTAAWETLLRILESGIQQCRAKTEAVYRAEADRMRGDPEWFTSEDRCMRDMFCREAKEKFPELGIRTADDHRRWLWRTTIDDCLENYLSHGYGRRISFINFDPPSPLPVLGRTGVCWQNTCTDFLVGVTSDGRPLTELPPAIQQCSGNQATFDLDGSPISLLLEEVDLNSDIRVVKFKMNPTNTASFTTWKASAKAPLLVLTKAEDRTVKDGTQLFGNWTFGGKRLASGEVVPWKNGYEALATLDADKDGTVSGKELDRLELWFDANRDGNSDPGELKMVESQGITKIFLTGTTTDSHTGDISMVKGYERLTNGQLSYGKTVDWFGKLGETYESLVEQISNQDRAMMIVPEVPKVQQVRHEAHQELSVLSGAWRFAATAPGLEKDRIFSGLLTFSTEGNTVQGHSYSLLSTRASRFEPRSTALIARSLTGKWKRDSEGKLTATWSLDSDAKGGSVLTSNAYYDTASDTLRGESILKYTFGEEARSYRYTWIASRSES